MLMLRTATASEKARRDSKLRRWRAGSLLRKHVAETARDERADGVCEHERHVHLREDDLVDTRLHEIRLDVSVALARKVGHRIVDKGDHKNRLPPRRQLGLIRRIALGEQRSSESRRHPAKEFRLSDAPALDERA